MRGSNKFTDIVLVKDSEIPKIEPLTRTGQMIASLETPEKVYIRTDEGFKLISGSSSGSINVRKPIIFVNTPQENAVNNDKWKDLSSFTATIRTQYQDFSPFDMSQIEYYLLDTNLNTQYGYDYPDLESAYAGEINKEPLPYNFPQIIFVYNPQNEITIGSTSLQYRPNIYNVAVITNEKVAPLQFHINNCSYNFLSAWSGILANGNISNFDAYGIDFKYWGSISFMGIARSISMQVINSIGFSGCKTNDNIIFNPNLTADYQSMYVISSDLMFGDGLDPTKTELTISNNSFVKYSSLTPKSLTVSNSVYCDFGFHDETFTKNIGGIYLTPTLYNDAGYVMPPYIKSFAENGNNRAFILPAMPKFILQIQVLTDTEITLLQEGDYTLNYGIVTILNPTMSGNDRVKILYGV